MNEQEVTQAVVDWIGDELGIPPEARYPYPVAVKTGPVTDTQPDVAGMVERKRIMLTPDAQAIFPYQQLQQIGELFRVFDVSASVMLSPGNDEGSARATFEALQEAGRKLEVSALADARLGERVPMISPAITFDYSSVYAEDSAGVTGRIMVCALTVGEPIDGAEVGG